MRPSPERFGIDGQASQPIVGLVVDRMDWHAREIASALAARGFGTAPIRLHLCGFATQSASGLQHRWFRKTSSRRGHRTLDVRRNVRSSHAAPWHSSRAARTRRHGLERCARYRALRRQIDDELSALSRRYRDAARPGRSNHTIRPRAIAQDETKEAALVSQAAIRLTGTWAAVDPQTGRPAATRRCGWRAFIICNAL